MAFLLQTDQNEALWYMSPFAFGVYLGILLLVVIFFVVWQVKTINRLKSQLSSPEGQEDKTIEPADIGIVNENQERGEVERRLAEVEAQLKSKMIELATIAKENDEKNELLKNIKKQIKELTVNPNSLARKTKEINQLLDAHLNSHNKAFEIQIDELHQELFKKLRVKYPDLTANDLRLCAYIKIGLNSKELADLLNIKPSSVYISRSRLRKKLNLDTDTDLHSYLNSL